MSYLIKVLAILALCTSISVSADEPTKAADIYERMKSLVGVWEKEGAKNADFNISFELTANGSTLFELWNYKGNKHSLTVYHLNGSKLMATHYCPQGNQPRLELSSDSTINDISFNYLDATNLKSLDESHQHYLSFKLLDLPNKITRSEIYLSKEGQKPSTLTLVRK